MANKIKTQFARISKKLTRYSFVFGCTLGMSMPYCSILDAQERLPVINGRISIDSLSSQTVQTKNVFPTREEPGVLAISTETPVVTPRKNMSTTQESEYKLRNNGEVDVNSLNSTWKKRGQLHYIQELVPAPGIEETDLDYSIEVREESPVAETTLAPAPAVTNFDETPQYYDVEDSLEESFLQVQNEEGTGKAGAAAQSELPEFENESDFFVIQESPNDTSPKQAPLPEPHPQQDLQYEYDLVETEPNPQEFREAVHTAEEKPGVFSLELEPVSNESVKPVSLQQESAFRSAEQQSNLALETIPTAPAVNNTRALSEPFENFPFVSDIQQFSPASFIEDISEETFENISQINPVFNDNQTFQQTGTAVSVPLPVTWTLSAEAMYLHRSDAEGSEALILCNDNGTPVDSFTGGDLDYDNELGMRFQAERRNPDGTGFHVEYFGVNDWSDARTITHPDLTVLNFDIGAGSGAISSDSEFHSFEINGRRDYDAWTNVFAGFRLLVLDETTAISGTGNAGSVFSQIDIENNMYGAQVGIDRTLYDKGGVLSIDTTFNLGLFYNSVNTHTINFPPGFSGSDNAASLLREWNFDMNLQLTESVSVAGGYTLIWLDDVALGPNQFLDRNNSVNADSNVFIHGGTLGLTYIW